MSLLGKSPNKRRVKVVRALFHFVFGAVVGLLPALLYIALTSLNSGSDSVGRMVMIVAVCSGSLGSVLAVLSLIRKGSPLRSLLKVLGSEVEGGGPFL